MPSCCGHLKSQALRGGLWIPSRYYHMCLRPCIHFAGFGTSATGHVTYQGLKARLDVATKEACQGHGKAAILGPELAN
eukprot:scaffold16864_cov27-Tisochrysis_lutea.AAC.9